MIDKELLIRALWLIRTLIEHLTRSSSEHNYQYLRELLDVIIELETREKDEV